MISRDTWSVSSAISDLCKMYRQVLAGVIWAFAMGVELTIRGVVA